MSSLVSYIESADWLANLPPSDSESYERHMPWSAGADLPPLNVEYRYRRLIYGIDLDQLARDGVDLEGYIDDLVFRALHDLADVGSAAENDELAESVKEERKGEYGGEGEPHPAVRRLLRGEIFFEAFRRELHKLLCSKDQESEAERDNILKQANIGQSTVALSISASIAPVLGTSAGMIAGAVTIVLAIISRVGMSAWCTMQSA